MKAKERQVEMRRRWCDHDRSSETSELLRGSKTLGTMPPNLTGNHLSPSHRKYNTEHSILVSEMHFISVPNCVCVHERMNDVTPGPESLFGATGNSIKRPQGDTKPLRKPRHSKNDHW